MSGAETQVREPGAEPRTEGFAPPVGSAATPGNGTAAGVVVGEGSAPGNGVVPAPVGGAGTALTVTDFGDDAGAGFENVRLSEQIVPFLRMAQATSPELKPQDGAYIRGLAYGMIFNTASREAYEGPRGVEAIVYGRDYHYGKWIPRDLSGGAGGFRGTVTPEDPMVVATLRRMTEKYGKSGRFKFPRFRDGRWTDEPDHDPDSGDAIELIETGHLYIAYSAERVAGDDFQHAIVPFTSTALPCYGGYVTRHNNATFPQSTGGRKAAPIWAYRWKLSAFPDKNNKGEYSNWRLDLVAYDNDGRPIVSPSFLQALYARQDTRLFMEGRRLANLFSSGAIKADREAYEAGMSSGDAGSRQPGEEDDNVPF